VAGGLAELPRVLEMMAREVEESKARDDRRGARIIEDYALVHTPAERDECVRQCWDQTRRLQAEVETLLARWHETIEEWGSVSRPVPSAVQREPVGGAAPLVSIALPR
jgi:hypothetical protein